MVISDTEFGPHEELLRRPAQTAAPQIMDKTLVAVKGACDDFSLVCRAGYGKKGYWPCAAFREEVYGALRNTERLPPASFQSVCK